MVSRAENSLSFFGFDTFSTITVKHENEAKIDNEFHLYYWLLVPIMWFSPERIILLPI